MDIFPPVKQRPPLLKLVQTLELSASTLRRDECGDWALQGKFGHIYASLRGFQIVVTGWTTRGWNLCKADLSFCVLRQDGGDEGTFTLNKSADPKQAELIRKWVGLRKKRSITDGQLIKLKERMTTINGVRARAIE